MKIVSIAILLIIFFCTCNKKKDVQGDLVGDEYIRGRLFLFDTLTRSDFGTFLPEKTVYIRYSDSKDTLNYLFSTKTDKDGYFTFSNLNKDKSYKVYYEEKINNVSYSAERVSLPPIDSLHLNAFISTKQNGVIYTIEDSSGGRISKATVCIYSNVSLFKPGSCDASNYTLSMDSNGHAFKFNIPKGTYYATVSTTINNAVMFANDTITIGDSITFKTLRLQKQGTGFRYVLLDITRSLVPGATVCVFTSQVLFNRDSCEGSNFQVVATNGTAEKRDLDPGHYLVYANLRLGNLIYVARDTIDIVTNVVKNDTLILYKKY
jgi:hypothetical protein